MLGEKPLILHVFERVSSVTQNVVVAARTTQHVKMLKNLLPSKKIVLDEREMQSPLVGFLSGLRALETAYVFAAPCDAPFIEPEVIRTLFKLALGKDCAIPVSDGKIDPLIAVYSRLSAIRAATNSLEQGEASMRSMLTRLEKFEVPRESLRKLDPQLLSFLNVNTELELMKAKRILQDQLRNRSRLL